MTHDADAARWWQDAPTLQRVVGDLLAGELALMRPGTRFPAQPWPSALDLRADLGADSLDLMGLASAMEAMLHLRRAPEAPLLPRTILQDWVDAAGVGLADDGSALTFRTSGSSGAPKACTHPLARLWQEADVLAGLFSGRRRIVSVVPSHHIYGFLFTVLLPRRLGLGPDGVLDVRAHAPGAVKARLREGDLVIGYPDSWRVFAAVTDVLAPDVVGVTSTAPCPDDVAQRAVAAGLAQLVQVYGSSETAGVGWRAAPGADYQLFPYWERGAQPDWLQRKLPDGTLRTYPLQDRLIWAAPDRFRPDGRIDQAVQVGGMNVFPAYVADVLKLHPGVQDASVRLMRPDEGARLKAYVVARAGMVVDAGALQAWLAARLSAPECPAAYTFGACLPRQGSGKTADWIIET